MAKKTYIQGQLTTPAKARSKRLQELGLAVVGGQVVTVAEASKSVTTPTQQTIGDGHTHQNKTLLDRLGETGDYLTKDGDKLKAGLADEATLAELANEAKALTEDSADWNKVLRRDQDTTTEHKITAADVESNQAETDELLVRTMANIIAMRSGADYESGTLGNGYYLGKDESGKWRMELDELFVRGTMTIVELLVQKVRSIGGQLVVSAANGKIKRVTSDDAAYTIEMEDSNQFVAGDFVKCQTKTGNNVKSYWAEVSSVTSDGHIVLNKSEFSTFVPQAGDEVVLLGSKVSTRQNAISISAMEDGQPRIDVLDGISTKSTSGCLRVRLGKLDGIVDNAFDVQPSGDGLYGDNVFLRGNFVLRNSGQTIENYVGSALSVMKDEISAEVSETKEDALLKSSYLNAPYFTDISVWRSTIQPFLLGGHLMALSTGGGSPALYTANAARAKAMRDGLKNVLYLNNGYVVQHNDSMRYRPTLKVDENKDGSGAWKSQNIYVSFHAKILTAGTLKIIVEHEDATGFASYEPLSVTKEMTVNDGYYDYEYTGQWNGTGDFRFSYTGKMMLYGIVLSSDRIADVGAEVSALRITAESISATVSEIYSNGKLTDKVIAESGLVIAKNGTTLYSKAADGTEAEITTYAKASELSAIALTADKVTIGSKTLGDVMTVADGNVSVDGYLRSTAMAVDPTITAVQIDNALNVIMTSTTQITLPVDAEYIGARVLLINSVKTGGVLDDQTSDVNTTTVIVGDGVKHTYDSNNATNAALLSVKQYLGVVKDSEKSKTNQFTLPTTIKFACGALELLGIDSGLTAKDVDGVTDRKLTQWCVVNLSAINKAIE